MPLQQILATADGLISKIFPKPGENRQKTNLEIQALCSFTSDQLSKEIADDIKVPREAGQEVNFNYYRQNALQLEQKGHVPKTVLKFGRDYRNASEPKIELWNTKDSTAGINTSLNFVQDKAIGFNSEEFDGNAEKEMDTNTWNCNLSTADRITSHKKRNKGDLGTCFMIEQNGINWVYILLLKYPRGAISLGELSNG